MRWKDVRVLNFSADWDECVDKNEFTSKNGKLYKKTQLNLPNIFEQQKFARKEM